MLDQRGTGRSTPVGDAARPQRRRAGRRTSTHFRADSIVRDAEAIRAELGVDRWSVLGQSFGGFCVDDLPLDRARGAARGVRHRRAGRRSGGTVDEVYRATYERILERNRRYYERYPEDRARVRALVERLDAEPLILPTGDRLTARRFRQARQQARDERRRRGAARRWSSSRPTRRPSATTSQDVLGFERNPIYAILHEACYADGVATRWSAERVMPAEYADTPELFTGEHVYPWMFEDYGALAPLREAAELLAAHEWPRLYDAERLARERGPGGGGGLRRRPLCRAGLLGGDRRARSAARAPGSPASTSTTACAPTATASWVA